MCIFLGGFMGNFIGIVVYDLNRKRGSYVDFEFFKYDGKDYEWFIFLINRDLLICFC